MALTGEEAYGLSTSYVDETLQGMGAVKGASAQVQGITDNADGTHTVTFAWQDNTGQSHTSTMTVSDGKDGVSVIGVTQTADLKSIILLYSDGTQSEPLTIPTVKGDNGKSAYDVAVDHGFVGTEAEWLESLKGADGATGAAGADGEDGFSSSIEVKESTSEKYVLTITNKDGEFDTPNLKGGGSGSASAMTDLEDVAITSLKNGQILKYNSATGKWVNADGVEIKSLGDIADVDLGTLKDGQIIAWDDTNKKWVNKDIDNSTQFETMPAASEYPQAIRQYIGADTANFKRAFWYRSTPKIESGNLIYEWVQTDTQPSNRDYEDLDNTPQINGVDVKGNKTSAQLGLQGQIQFETLPTPTAANVGRVCQYVGSTTADLKSNYWYQVQYDSATASYKWGKVDVSGNSELSEKIAALETNQGDMSTLAVAGVTDIVSALNALNNKGLQSINYTEPNLVITYKDNTTYTYNVRDGILRETQLGELANVNDSTIADGNTIVYDTAIVGYKPYDILTALANTLSSAKQYTDEEIASSITADAIATSGKPIYDSDSGLVIYTKDGETHTTDKTDTRFYYTLNGESFSSSWIDGVEFTTSIAAVSFDDFVSKSTDIVSTYTEDMADKTKVPNVASLDALVSVIKEYLSAKINTTSIVDGLTSQDSEKVLSANQGYVLNEMVGAKQDKVQYASMPVADSSLNEKIIQYVGNSSVAYVNGYWYKCVYDSENDIWVWAEIKYSADTDSELSDTSENPVQNKVIKAALDEKQSKTLSVPIEINGMEYTTVESAIAAILALANLKQPKTLETAVEVDGAEYSTVETALSALAGKTVSVDGSTIAKDEDTGALSAVKATNSTFGIVQPDNDTIRINEDGLLEGADQTDLSDYETSKTFTQAEWAALSDEEKAKYDIVNFSDDTASGGAVVVDEVTKGNLNAVTSNAVAEVTEKLSLFCVSIVDEEYSVAGTAKDYFDITKPTWNDTDKCMEVTVTPKAEYKKKVGTTWLFCVRYSDMVLTPMFAIGMASADLVSYTFPSGSYSNGFTGVDVMGIVSGIVFNFYTPSEKEVGLDFDMFQIL